MGNRWKNRLMAQGLTALFLTAAAARAEVCCGSIDGFGSIYARDTGQTLAEEGRLDLYVDSIGSYYDYHTYWHSYIALRVLAKRPVDTTVFFDIMPQPGATYPSRPGSISYTGTGFSDTLLVLTDGYGVGVEVFKAGDTLKDVFTLRMTSSLGLSYYAFSGIHCKFQSPSPDPFPIGEALAALERYMDSLGISRKGYGGSGPSHLKLGPVFIATLGDPGLLVTATAKGNDWIIRHQVGGGDCPAGCTEHTETWYRVSKDGKIAVVPAAELSAICGSANALRPKPFYGRMSRAKPERYTPDGRKVPGNGKAKAHLPWIEVPRP